MNIEVIAIGNEILNGYVVNTNASFLSEELSDFGFSPNRHSVVSDEKENIKEIFIEALNRSQIVISTGGAGLTSNNNAKKVAFELFQDSLDTNQEVANELFERYGDISSLPKRVTGDFKVLNDMDGLEKGYIFKSQTSVLILLPGIPDEMKHIFINEIKPFLKKNFISKKKCFVEKIDLCLLKAFDVEPFLKNLQKKTKKIKFTLYPSYGTVSIHMEVNGEDEEEANKLLNPFKEEIYFKFAENIYHSENGKIESAIHHSLLEKNKSLVIAESCTGGVLASKITAMPNASKYFLGSIVAYSNELKKNVLSVNEKVLMETGSVSVETVKEMISNLFKLTSADYAIAISGIAGPLGGTTLKPVGTVCLAVAKRDEKIDAGILNFRGNRSMIVDYSANFALGILYRQLVYNLNYF